MDQQFLEFWGNFLINAARGQRQLEDVAKWMQQGFSGFDDLTAMFKKFYGLESVSEDLSHDGITWEKAAEDFQNSFKDFLNLMGVVSREEHLKLTKKYEDLKEKVTDQEETIKNLRKLLDDKGVSDQSEVVKSFQDLMDKQSQQFKDLTEVFGQFFKK